MFDLKSILLKPTDTVETSIRVLHEGGIRIALVVDESGVLLGTVTDGDIRRALLKHLSMETSVTEVMRVDPTVASVSEDRESIMQLMKSRDLLHVPIVNEKGRLVGLETLQNLLEGIQYDNPVFLMAGGFGKRLMPLTNNIPKPLLPVGNKPILETILNQFVKSGFRRFYISTHYKAEMVRSHFGDGSKWGVSIHYVHEDQPLGTAGALGLLPKDIPNLPIIMMNGDLLTKVNFEQLLRFHNEHGNIATMSVCKYEFQVPYGVIEQEGHAIKSFIEKPTQSFLINAGIYVLEPSIISSVVSNEYLDMPQLLKQQLAKGKQVNIFPIHEYWLDIGRKEEYQLASESYNEEMGL